MFPYGSLHVVPLLPAVAEAEAAPQGGGVVVVDAGVVEASGAEYWFGGGALVVDGVSSIELEVDEAWTGVGWYTVPSVGKSGVEVDSSTEELDDSVAEVTSVLEPPP